MFLQNICCHTEKKMSLELEEKIRTYSEYWGKGKYRPKTILSFNFWKGDDDKFVKAPDLQDTEYYAINYFTTEELTKLEGINSDNFHHAQDQEIKARIYNNIHQNNVFDHLMPVESKSYFGAEHV